MDRSKYFDSGDRMFGPYPDEENFAVNRSGAGAVVMPPIGSHLHVGSDDIGDHEVLEIAFDVGKGATRLDTAIWWPEAKLAGTMGGPVTNDHAMIGLYLYDPTGYLAGYSFAWWSVFQKIAVVGNDNLPSGSWKLRIVGGYVPATLNRQAGLQRVYRAHCVSFK
jgi:hypothetical protein